MGLSARRHRRVLVAELAVPLTVGLAGGLLLTAAIVWTVRADLEINPKVPPATVVAVPYGAVAAISALVALVALTSALVLHRRVARSAPAEALRL